jgi:hypothetical protein
METGAVSSIFLDWDVRWSSWHRETRKHPTSLRGRASFEHRLDYAMHRLGTPMLSPVRVYYRKSAGRHVHVRVDLPFYLGFRDQLLLRLYLSDDRARIAIDVSRYFKAEPINRLFDTKCVGGRIRKAGPWVRWFRWT